MNALALVLVLFVAGISCFSEQEYRNEFTNWMQKHSKMYSSEEFQTRYSVFKNNMDYVSKFNAANSETKLGLNVMADLSNEEYRKIYLGTKAVRQPAANIVEEPVNAPASVDWRQQGAVTPIKNQGQCGGCWSFSTTGSVEGITKITTGTLVSLSEQNLIDCSTKYGNNGCDGGLMDDAFKYIIANKGIDTEASYPYQAVNGKCRYNAANSGATITGYTDVTSGSESALQAAVAQQPVSVAIDASHNSFQLYESGVYFESACSSTQLDHGVLAIGYGTSGSQDYWLVKNSWGTTWGQQGYIWMSRNKNNNCGIATMASYPTGAALPSTGSSSGQTTKSNTNTNTNTNGQTTKTHTATGPHTANTANTANTGNTYGAGLESSVKVNAGGKGFQPLSNQANKFKF